MSFCQREGARERKRGSASLLAEELRSHSTVRPTDLHIRRICRLRPRPHDTPDASAGSGCQLWILPSRMAKRRTARGIRASFESLRLGGRGLPTALRRRYRTSVQVCAGWLTVLSGCCGPCCVVIPNMCSSTGTASRRRFASEIMLRVCGAVTSRPRN